MFADSLEKKFRHEKNEHFKEDKKIEIEKFLAKDIFDFHFYLLLKRG
jgi:uncharacterized protein YbcI